MMEYALQTQSHPITYILWQWVWTVGQKDVKDKFGLLSWVYQAPKHTM